MQPHTYAIMNRVEDEHWWYVGRRAVLEDFMRRIAENLQKNKRDRKPLEILDVGCGSGGNLEMLQNFGAAQGVDISDEALEFCRRKGLQAQKSPAETMPYGDETFDVTTALDVIEHLDDDIKGLREMFRVTKRGGKSLFFVPAFMFLWGVQDDVSNHRIRYTKRQIVERIERAGYRVERATYANFTFFAPILTGRFLMKLTGIKPASENNVNINALNGIFGKLFASERFWLRKFGFPFGVSIVVVAEKP